MSASARAVSSEVKQATYMEFSPSGTGIHLLFKGVKPVGGCKNSVSGIEMYCTTADGVSPSQA